MPNLLTSGRRTRALIVAAVMGLCVVSYGQDSTDPNNGYGPTDRPVFAFISAEATFDLPILGVVDRHLRTRAASLGSPMICLKIGTFVAGDTIETTRFESTGPATFDPDEAPSEPGPGELHPEYVGNHLT